MKNFFTKYRNLIGFGLVLIGGPLGAVTAFPLFYAVAGVGVFLFASFRASQTFCDYIIVESTDALVKKRDYIIFIPFYLVSLICTLGRGKLMIPCRQEHFIVHYEEDGSTSEKKISRKEYKSIRKEQRRIYSEQKIDQAFMSWAYSEKAIGLRQKRTRLILAGIFTAISLLMVFDPAGGMYISAVYTPVFLPMLLLWIPEYKDAKILQRAYERSGAAELEKNASKA